MTDCPCCSGLPFDSCCGPLLSGAKPAPTAEALMRSRYTAFVTKDLDYIERTCTLKARGDYNRLDLERFVENATWQGLQIGDCVAGGPDDQRGEVNFTFHFTHKGAEHTQSEQALFCREEGEWRYEDSVFPSQEPVRLENKAGRNDPCPCGSGKKFKKCCGN